MFLNGPILSVEDDDDDQFMIGQALQALKVTNPVRFFSNGLTALHYLETTDEKPFLILSDINMPLMNGLELHAHINRQTDLKCQTVPFVFLTTAPYSQLINAATGGLVQGYFPKPTSFYDLCELLKIIIDYWQLRA